jgi:hypothetical protein
MITMYSSIYMLNQIFKYTVTDDGSMEPKRVWEDKVNKQPIIVVKGVG